MLHLFRNRSVARRAIRTLLAVLFGAFGIAVLLRADNITPSLFLLFLANFFAWPPRPPDATRPVRDLLDSTAEVKVAHVLLAFALVGLFVLALSFSGSFWSWLTDHISYSPPQPRPMPLWARLSCVAFWVCSLALGLFRSYRAPRIPGAPAT